MALEIGNLIKPAQDALAPVGGTLSDIWQGVVGDRVAAWRLKNAVKIQCEIHRELEEAGLALNASKIPERYAFAWFEEATQQDEPEIQALFARLLVRAANGDEHAKDRRHITLLSQLTPADAQVFAAMFDPKTRQGLARGMRHTPPVWDEGSITRKMEREVGEHARASIEHLVNIGIVSRAFRLELGGMRSVRRYLNLDDVGNIAKAAAEDLKIERELCATVLGMSLYSAVREVKSDLS